jgi:hypothetical protein
MIAIAVLFFSCNGEETEVIDNSPQTTYNAISDTIPKEELQLYIDSVNEANLTKEQKNNNEKSISFDEKYKSISSRFNVKSDEFKGVKFYTPKHISSKYILERNTIYAYCNSMGTVFIVSNLYKDDWLFHESFSILYNGTVINSSNVEYKNKITDVLSGGKVYENNTYFNETSIFYLLAAIDPADVVKVRFNGRQYYKDITLSKADLKSFRDVQEMSDLIIEAKKQGVSL